MSTPERPGHHQFFITSQPKNEHKFLGLVNHPGNKGKDPLEIVLEEVNRMGKKLFFDRESEFQALVENLRQEKYDTPQTMVKIAAKKVADFAGDNYSLLELEKRDREGISESKTKLSEIFSYNFTRSDPNRLSLHLEAASTLATSEKLKHLREGLRKLAQLMETDPRLMKVTSVYAKSWIVKEQPGIFQKIGFHLLEENNTDRALSIRRAEISREDFLNYVHKGE